MTRVNVVPVKELTREHLIAEYKEIMRLPGNIKKSLNRKSTPFSEKEIPPHYKMGKGHVKFFFNKMSWVKNRFEELIAEMKERNYNVNYTDSSIFDDCPEYWKNDYKPTLEALEINRQRIKERLGDN